MIIMKNIFTNGNGWQKHYNIMFPVNTDGTAKTAFNSDMQETLFEIEDSSWWFQYRGTVIKNLINKFFDADRFICDIGGGNGFTTKLLQDSGYEVVLLEPSQTACLNGHKRGIKNIICGTLNNGDFKDESIENCCLLDVLEHIENDADFLRLIHKKLVSSGKILITVPALKSLWSSEDDIAGHFRRYSKKELEQLLVQNGFQVIYSNYFFSFLLVPIFIFRALKSKLFRGDKRKLYNKSTINHHKNSNKMITTILNLIEKAEMKYLISNKRVLTGSSIILIATK